MKINILRIIKVTKKINNIKFTIFLKFNFPHPTFFSALLTLTKH